MAEERQQSVGHGTVDSTAGRLFSLVVRRKSRIEGWSGECGS